MGLFDFFIHKTVESKYKRLFSLFRRADRSFTITRSEKCIVEFTYGRTKESLQYWKIEQYFDATKIKNPCFEYDFSKIVYISVHTNIEGNPIVVDKFFHQSTNQLDMYNIIMKEFIDKVLSTLQSVAEEEEEEENNNTEETVTNKENIAEEEKIIFVEDWKLIDFARKFGRPRIGSFTNTTTGEKFTACIFTDRNEVRTYASFYSELGELSPAEITQRKDSLYVGKLENGRFVLYSKDNKGWKIKSTTNDCTVTTEEKSSNPVSQSENPCVKFIALADFEKTHGSLSSVSIVCDLDGYMCDIYVCINSRGDHIYVCPSPYLGVESIEKISQNKSDYFIECEEPLGIYLLCTRESVKNEKTYSDVWPYYHEEFCCRRMLTRFNIEHDFEDYTIEYNE